MGYREAQGTQKNGCMRSIWEEEMTELQDSAKVCGAAAKSQSISVWEVDGGKLSLPCSYIKCQRQGEGEQEIPCL